MLREALRRLRSPSLPGLPPLFAGAVGYLGYDLVRELERLPDQTEDDLRLPEGMLVFPRSVVVFDHLGQRLVLVANVVVNQATDLDAAYADAIRRIDALAARLSVPVADPDPAADGRAAGRRRQRPRPRPLPGDGPEAWSTSAPATSSRWSRPSGSRCRPAPTRSTSTGSCGWSTPRPTCTSCACPG